MGFPPMLLRMGLAIGLLVAPAAVAQDPPKPSPETLEFFEKKIRPVLAEICFRCHGGQKTSGQLRVDSAEALLKGGETGPALVSGQPGESLLLKAIRREEGVSAMPPEVLRACGFMPFDDAEQALRWALQQLGDSASVLALPDAGSSLPAVSG